MRDWAKFAGFAAILAVALSGGLTWVLPNLFLSNPLERTLAQCSQTTRREDQKTSDQQTDTSNASTVEKDRKTPRQDETTNQTNENITYECLIAAYTGKLAQFTEWLAWVTFILIVVGIGQGVQLANSVRLARDEFLSTHRPRVRIKHLWPASDIWNGQEIVLNLAVVNTGIVEATLNTTGIRLVIVAAEQPIPFDPNIPNAPGINIGGSKLATGVWLTINGLRDGTRLTDQQVIDIEAGLSKLYCVGFISYLDAANKMRITGFCRVLTLPPIIQPIISACRFRKFDDPDYDYED